jgi:Flp pilus assembly protein TadG
MASRTAVASETAQSEAGQSLIEFAMIFSILIGLIFAFIELCLAFYSFGMISESAREGSRYAMVRGSTCVNGAKASCVVTASQVNSYVSGLGFPNIGGGKINVTTTYPDGNENPGSRVHVQVTYQFPITLPFVPSRAISIASTSEMNIVQ